MKAHYYTTRMYTMKDIMYELMEERESAVCAPTRVLSKPVFILESGNNKRKLVE